MKNSKEFNQYLNEYKNYGEGLVKNIASRFKGEGWIETKALLIASGEDPYTLREAYIAACDYFGIERPLDRAVLTNSRIEFEGHFEAYKLLSDMALIKVKKEFSGDSWKLNRASLERAGQCPFAIKEAYLKVLDLRGIDRPDCGRFVEESEAINDADFWNTSANPVTGTKIHSDYDWTEDVNNSVDYGYKY